MDRVCVNDTCPLTTGSNTLLDPEEGRWIMRMWRVITHAWGGGSKSFHQDWSTESQADLELTDIWARVQPICFYCKWELLELDLIPHYIPQRNNNSTGRNFAHFKIPFDITVYRLPHKNALMCNSCYYWRKWDKNSCVWETIKDRFAGTPFVFLHWVVVLIICLSCTWNC